ncbi:hypothetical protein TSAR_014432, partial [Trichomalopsis sarcophagae]
MQSLKYNRIQNILSLIDCFKRQQNEEAFYNHQAGTSINVQVILDADNIIKTIRVCPGSATDSFIWQFSDSQQERDNGYTASPILLTLIVSALEGSLEIDYTYEYVTTRLFWNLDSSLARYEQSTKIDLLSRENYQNNYCMCNFTQLSKTKW